MPAKDAPAGSVADVEVYFKQIRHDIAMYRKNVDKLTAIRNDKKKALDRVDLVNERTQIKQNFIAHKNSARANIKLLKQGLDVLKDRELAQLVADFRDIDGEFKALGVMADSEELFEGRKGLGARADKFDPTRAKNDELLDKAREVQESNLSKLKAGLQQVEQTKEQAKYTAATLEQGREKLKRIDSGLDEVQSELELSRVLLTRFVKRLYTDKVIIAFTFLLVLGIAGIITYAILNPDQKIFNVPDVVKPNFIPGVASPSPSATPGTQRLLRNRAEGAGLSLFGSHAAGSSELAAAGLLPEGAASGGAALQAAQALAGAAEAPRVAAAPGPAPLPAAPAASASLRLRGNTGEEIGAARRR